MPYLPPAAQPEPPPVEEPEFDAKAMVQAMTRKVEQPAYGSLPAATAENREAAQRLREQARRKRQRNRNTAWFVAVAFLGAIGTAGFLAYREYGRDQDRKAAERAAAAAEPDEGSATEALLEPDEAVTEGGADDPFDEQEGMLEAADDLGSTAQSSGGGLLGAVEDARAAADALNDAQDLPDGEVGGAAPGSEVAAFPDYRSISLHFRRYDTAAPGSPFTSYTYDYDSVDDNTILRVDRSDAAGDVLMGFTDAWRMSIRFDGVVDRVLRSGASIAPGPESPWASLFGEAAVMPPEALPFAVEQPVEESAGLEDGHRVRSYSLDTAAFRRAEPDAYAAWQAFWTAPAPDDGAFVDPSVRQVLADPPSTESLSGDNSIDFSDFEGQPLVDGALVVSSTNRAGYVELAFIYEPEQDFRVVWVLDLISDDPAFMRLDDLDWIDAPAE
ncbi:MAG: hypothetical protein QNJ12_20265 [Ilumatobacter sp.]|uniref:hypothetical protein n=1 Tax=Ilumatobacter sp. TaxID=1967498 RepID=UPI0026055EFC|nr:hypothetical protein [Ilumatobacter sp.]MDJ0771135.1 hypothetical protein [Ilumatobacter sp.]